MERVVVAAPCVAVRLLHPELCEARSAVAVAAVGRAVRVLPNPARHSRPGRVFVSGQAQLWARMIPGMRPLSSCESRKSPGMDGPGMNAFVPVTGRICRTIETHSAAELAAPRLSSVAPAGPTPSPTSKVHSERSPGKRQVWYPPLSFGPVIPNSAQQPSSLYVASSHGSNAQPGTVILVAMH